LRQRVIAAHHLDAMEPGEMEPYIMHRLRLVGWNGNPTFDPRVFAEIHRDRGVPRRINQIVNRLLILGAVEQRQHIDGVMLAQVLAELTADGGLQIAPAPAQPGEGLAVAQGMALPTTPQHSPRPIRRRRPFAPSGRIGPA
jgi:hypothetical protein